MDYEELERGEVRNIAPYDDLWEPRDGSLGQLIEAMGLLKRTLQALYVELQEIATSLISSRLPGRARLNLLLPPTSDGEVQAVTIIVDNDEPILGKMLWKYCKKGVCNPS